MLRKFVLLVASSLSVFSSAVFAVGLGDYKLNSGHNQPLKAEIKLLSVEDLSEHELTVALASSTEFDKVGVERLFFLNDIRFKTVKKENGDMIVELTTRDTIKEPFLNFLLELTWPNGRIIREYTFLLDPPVFDSQTSSTLNQASSSQAQSSVSTEPERPTAQPAKRESVQASQTTGSTYGPVSSSDTLWGIASKVKPASASIHQTLVAIYRNNPDSFSNGNINNLMRGSVLQIPSEAEISQVPHRAALQDVVVQNKQWKAGGSRRIIESSEKTASSTDVSTEPRLSLAPPAGDAKYSGTDSVSGGGQQAALVEAQNALVRSQEKGATLEAENEELRARLADLLKKLDDQKSGSLIQIADAEMAAMTQASTPTESSATESILDSTEMEEPQLEETPATESVSSSVSDDSPVAEAEPQVAAPVAQVAEKPAMPGFVAPKPAKGFLEELLDSGIALWAGLGGIIVLVVMMVIWRMRKRMEDEDFQDDLVASAGAASSDPTESFELPDVGDDMLVDLDSADDDEGGLSSSEESFDPLGEADMYIAYGKFDQAERLLVDAIESRPQRADLKAKLLECYVENDDQEKFESVANEISRSSDASEWMARVQELRSQAWGDQATESGSDDGFDLPSTEDIFGEDDSAFEAELDSMVEDDALEDEAPGLEADDSMDSSFDFDQQDSDDDYNLDSASDDEFDVDMDFNENDADVSSSDAVTQTFDSLDEDDFALDQEDEGDFESELDEQDDESEESLDEDEFSLDEEDDISLEMENDEFAFDSDEESFDEDPDLEADEISTKLDLARAYIDMGDADGAKEILDEVLAEGSAAQKAEAEKLIGKLD